MRNLCSIGARKLTVVCLLLCLLWGFPSFAQQAANSTSSQDETSKQLLDRIRELEARLKQLEDKQASNPSAPVAVPAPAIVEAQSPETPRPAAQGSRLQMHIFGDVGYAATDHKGSTNAFHIGSFDLFATSRLTDKISLLGEVLFISTQDNAVNTDLERLLFQYEHDEHFNFAVGRYHSSIGYYNTAFHQGQWFQTAIGRPFMYEFDDHGGFLPLQEVGVTTHGTIPSGRLGLHYVAEIGNGRSHLLGSEPAQNIVDSNNGKSFNLAIFSRPSWVSGLQTGFSYYQDRLTFPDAINHKESIMAAHVVYQTSEYEFLNEALLVRHTDEHDGPVFYNPGWYTQFSRRFGSYRPYFRYSYMNANARDPIYSDAEDATEVGRKNGPSAGIRYDFSDYAAVKLQYDRVEVRGGPSSNGLATQFAFTF